MSKKFVTEIREACERFGLSDVELSALCGVSIPKVREARLGGRLPKREPPVRRLEAFAARAREASARGDLRLP